MQTTLWMDIKNGFKNFGKWWKDIMDNEPGTKEALMVLSVLFPVTVIILLVVFWL